MTGATVGVMGGATEGRTTGVTPGVGIGVGTATVGVGTSTVGVGTGTVGVGTGTVGVGVGVDEILTRSSVSAESEPRTCTAVALMELAKVKTCSPTPEHLIVQTSLTSRSSSTKTALKEELWVAGSTVQPAEAVALLDIEMSTGP